MKQKQKQKQQLLLLQDVIGLGRSGDLATAKPGYTRNFLLPQKKAVVADKHTLKLRAKLQEERAKQAAADKADSEKIADQLRDFVLITQAKVDPEGHMYGSVSNIDISNLLQEQGIHVERSQVAIGQAIKKVGTHKVPLKLKEGIVVNLKLEIKAEGVEERLKLEDEEPAKAE